jgi:hypothetical protein
MGRVSAPDPLSRRQRLVSALCHHFDVEHHALVFMVQDMAVEDEPADVARVGGADKNTVTALDKIVSRTCPVIPQYCSSEGEDVSQPGRFESVLPLRSTILRT